MKTAPLATLAFLLLAHPAVADTIVQNTAGSTGNIAGYYGQSVLTPSGPSWNNIAFAFAAGGANIAAGASFLLSSQYAGTPANLNSSTPGFIAQSMFVGEGNGAWTFAPGVTLLPSTTYFFYSNFNFAAGSFLGGASGVPGGAFFSTAGNFSSLAPVDENFRLTGSAAVPEPSTLLTCLLGLLLLSQVKIRRFSR